MDASVEPRIYFSQGYVILQNTIAAQQGTNSKLAAAVGKDVKGKLSLALYAAAIPLAFVHQWISEGSTCSWRSCGSIPDRRIESKLNH